MVIVVMLVVVVSCRVVMICWPENATAPIAKPTTKPTSRTTNTRMTVLSLGVDGGCVDWGIMTGA